MVIFQTWKKDFILVSTCILKLVIFVSFQTWPRCFVCNYRSHRDGYGNVMGKGQLPRDPYPQWRTLSWSPDNTMVTCSSSDGTVDAFDIVGTKLFTIPGTRVMDSLVPIDLSFAVAAIVFTKRKVKDPMCFEMLVINYHGSLRSYAVDRDNGFQLQHTFLFNTQYPLGVSSVVYHPGADLLVVGGCSSDADSAPSQAIGQGLSLWRVLSDEPYYKLVTDYDFDQQQAAKKKSFMRRMKSVSFLGRKTDLQDGVFKLSISPDNNYISAIHYSGTLSVWHLPSLKPYKLWKLEDQPNFDEISPEFTENPQRRKTLKDLPVATCKALLDVNWWSNSALILSRCTGAVTVSSSYTLKNLLGTSPEWFEPASRVTAVHDGGFLGLEVDNKFPQKRRLGLDEEEEDYEDSDDDDISLASRATRYTKNVLYWMTDSERFQPPRKRPKMVTRTYRLVCLKSTTPEELYTRKIDNEEYGEALALARAYGLDTDRVYQRQWRKSAVSVASIQDYLSKISKRSWVLHECLERMPDTIDAMKELLEFGLRGTDLQALIAIGKKEDGGRFILCDPEEGLYEDMSFDEFNPEDMRIKEEMKRKKQEELLQQEILGGVNWAAERFNPDFFKEFRSRNIVEVATDYARNSDWKALDLLFLYHGELLVPHRLAILSNFPETTNPLDYKDLLPVIGTGDHVQSIEMCSWRETDWCENKECRSAVEPITVDLGDFLYEDNPDLQTFRNDTLSRSVLVEWYKYRACEIERLSRLVDNAVDLIKFAIEGGITEDLDELLDDLVTMEMLVYECQVDETLTFSQLQAMADYDKLELIMSKVKYGESSKEMYSKNLHRWMVVFLNRCEKRTRGAYVHLLRDYVITKAKTDLTLCFKVFDASKVTLVNRVIPEQTDLMAIALEALYACERDDQLSLICDIVQCLPQKGFSGTESKRSLELHKEVDKLEKHIGAAKIFEKYGMKKPLFYIRDTENDAEEAKSLMTKLTRVAGHRAKPLSQLEWRSLHDDVIELQDKVYRCISAGLCHEIFTESLLCSSTKENITLAGEFMERSESENRPTVHTYPQQPKVPYNKSIQLVLSAAREYFNSSADLTDSCMDLARACLNLIRDTPPPEDIQEELDLIASLALLDDFGVATLPLQVRMSKERLELVKAALESQDTAYQQTKKMLRLGHLLRVDVHNKASREGKILHLIADTAVKHGDYSVCHEVCEDLMSRDYGSAWNVCVDLAWEEDFSDIDAKMKLLTFAMTYCDGDMIEPILQAKALLETQVLYDTIHKGTQEKSSVRGDNPFSPSSALKQTKQILTSTTKTTKAVLSTVADKKWWEGTIQALKQPMQRQTSEIYTDNNEKFERQGIHPFYANLQPNAYQDLSAVDYSRGTVSEDPSVEISENLLRTVKLEEMMTDGEKSEPATEVLLKLSNAKLATDSTLGLAYLLALPCATDAEKCFDTFPKTAVTLQLALYYYALQIYSSVKPLTDRDMNFLYQLPPHKVMTKVISFVNKRKDFDWPQDVLELIPKLKQYSEELEDYIQAKTLQGLGRGVDIIRFTDEDEYKRETILGLAMTLEDNVYDISVSLAQRYDIQLWEIYMAHLEFLFSDSGLSTEEMEQRVNKMKILETLKTNTDEFVSRMDIYVYPTIDGTDLDRLRYYYSLLPHSGLKDSISPDDHVKLIKKIKPAVPGLNYKNLMDPSHNAVDVIVPVLTSSNVNVIAKLASKIPDGHGGFLHPSVVHCAWAVQTFWSTVKIPSSVAGWIHRYESCGETLQKLLPSDVINFTDAVVFVRDSREKLELECRQEIVKRTLKFSRQQGGKKKKMDDSKQRVSWEDAASVLLGYQSHLESLKNDTLSTLQEDADLAVYIEHFDLSKGNLDKLKNLYTNIILDGVPLDVVSSFLEVVNVGWQVKSATQEAISKVIQQLRSDGKVLGLKKRKVLTCLEDVVTNIQSDIERGESRVTVEDVMELLRSYCSDSNVAVKPRLDVLFILEKSFNLSEGDLVLLILYRTQAVVKSSWTDIEVEEDDINSDDKRYRLWQKLLEQSSSCSQYLAVCKLLQLWPKLSATSEREEDGHPWFVTLTKMLGDSTSLREVYPKYKEICDTVPLSAKFLYLIVFLIMTLFTKCVEQIFHGLVSADCAIDGCKLVMISGKESLLTLIIQVLTDHKQVVEDEELFDLLLKCNLVTKMVHTVFYPQVIDYVLANQSPDGQTPDHLSAHQLVAQLKEAGLEAEAGSLLLQTNSTHPMLQTIGAAFTSLSKWWK
ncbi:hypothetical protein FSP39_008222 [Pinctada imbricata]|uniref:Neuroblastoma-amplified sequence n=1 Tax=Pinctada imbricata TaxID=66713 RepID=A0AA88Y858_PINIB|nr:hypothetical protein FSP39_008222 [Pinctada imbricata]